jgi:predicted MPP superfamily phosphohydrolase
VSLLSRRQFLTATAGALSAATLGEALVIEPGAVQVTRHDLAVPGLSAPLVGTKIACVTDLHLHKRIGRAARATLELLGHERPDVVVLVGDMCNAHRDLAHLTAWARDARGAAVMFATLGNWEHQAEIDRGTAEVAYQRAGAQLLYNSVGRLTRGDATLAVVGLDDPVLGRPDLRAALALVRPAEPTLWIVHAPGYVDRVPPPATPRPAAILTGHTHGGQLRLPFWTPYTPTGSGRFVAGWYRDTVAPLYVSRGIGTVVVPARLCCPPELPIFTLRDG